METIQSWLREASTKLTASSTPRLDAELLLCKGLGFGHGRTVLLSQLDRKVSKKEVKKLNQLLARRVNGEPVAYIIGSIEFYGLNLNVDPSVLCPRPETEMLVERVVKTVTHELRIVDVGTGSGAIAAAIKKYRPDLQVMATDIDLSALGVARSNFAQLNLNIQTKQSDLLKKVSGVDVIVANLPYLPQFKPLDPSVKYEPKSALLSGKDGLNHYQQLFTQLHEKPKVKQLYLEAEPDQKPQLVSLAEKTGFKLVWHRDYSYQFSS